MFDFNVFNVFINHSFNPLLSLRPEKQYLLEKEYETFNPLLSLRLCMEADMTKVKKSFNPLLSLRQIYRFALEQ